MIYWIGIAILAIIYFCITKNMAILAGIALFIGLGYCIVLLGRWGIITVWEFLEDYPILQIAAVLVVIYAVYMVCPPLGLVLLGGGVLILLSEWYQQWCYDQKVEHKEALLKWLNKNGCYLGQVQKETM